MGIKIKNFSWSGAFSVVGRGGDAIILLTSYLFLFGLNVQQILTVDKLCLRIFQEQLRMKSAKCST